MAKQIKQGEEARKALCAGIDTLKMYRCHHLDAHFLSC